MLYSIDLFELIRDDIYGMIIVEINIFIPNRKKYGNSIFL